MGTFATKEVSYADEASFCENELVGVWTWSKRIPVLDVRPDFTQDRQDDRSLQIRQNESRPGYLMTRKGSLEIDVLWCGHMSDPVGALTETWLQDLLSDGLGGGDVTQVGGTASGGATTTSLPYAGATLVRGGVLKVGSGGDGRAEGRYSVIGTAPSPASLLIALPAAPNAGDVIRVAQMAYPKETLGTTKRFLVGHTITGAQWVALGCQLAGFTLKSVYDEVAILTLRYTVALWGGPIATSVPQVANLEDCKAAPMAGTDLNFQTVGTTTRNQLQAAEVELTVNLGLAEKRGPTPNAYRTIIGYERTKSIPTLKLRMPWDNSFHTLYDTDGSDTTHKHILAVLNNQNGRAVGGYLPRAYPVGPRPQIDEYNELGYVTTYWRGREGTDTTNDLTRSAFRLFAA